MQTLSQTDGSSFLQRALITGGAVVLLLIGFRITLPGVDAAAVHGLGARSSMVALFSAFSIGVVPIVSGAFILEVVKLIFPRLHAWEVRSERNATILQRIWLALSLSIAAFQGQGVSSGILGIDGLVPNPQGFVPIAVASFLGTTALLFWLCLAVTRHGLVGGLWLLFATQMIMGAPTVATEGGANLTFGAPEMRAAILYGAILLAVVALLAVVGARVARDDEPDRAGALIWPVLLGYYTAGLVQAAFILTGNLMLAGRPAHLVIFVIVAILITLMRMPNSETGAAANARIVLTLLQVAAVVGASIVLGAVALPFSFNPIALVASAAVVQVVAENAPRRG